MTLFMETTNIPPEKTVGEIQNVLGRYGASGILLEYKDREIEAVSFRIDAEGRTIPFRLPCRWEAIHKTLMERRERNVYNDDVIAATITKAKRIAWRQILRWVQAQLALVETNMVSLPEVFMPYITNAQGKTLYELASGNGFKMLGPGQ